MYLLMSLMAIKNSVTLNEDPCGNPFSVSNIDERECLTLTLKDLSVKKLSINLRMLPLTFHF